MERKGHDSLNQQEDEDKDKDLMPEYNQVNLGIEDLRQLSKRSNPKGGIFNSQASKRKSKPVGADQSLNKLEGDQADLIQRQIAQGVYQKSGRPGPKVA